MKKGLFIFLAYFLILGVSSCLNNNNDDDCGSSSPEQFDINKIDYQLINIELDTTDNKASYQVLSTKDSTILYSNYGIEVVPEIEFVTIIDTKNDIFNSIFPSAYACIPAPTPYTLATISNIEIITNQDFDSTHLAGSNISDLFQVIESFYYSSSDVYTVQEYLNMKDEHTKFQRGEPFLLHLNSSPMKKEKYEFTVKITLENTAIDVTEYKTKEVIITNQ